MSDSHNQDEATQTERPLQAMFDQFYKTCFSNQEILDMRPDERDKKTIVLGSGLLLTIDNGNGAKLR